MRVRMKKSSYYYVGMIKIFPNYPLQPSMPASRHLEKALRIPVDYQLLVHSDAFGIMSNLYLSFCLIAVDSEGVTVIVVGVEAIMHRVMPSVYRFFVISLSFIGDKRLMDKN